MTPAVDLATKYKLDFIVHQYLHDSQSQSYGLEAADKLAVDTVRVFKTLVVIDEKGILAVAIVPVNNTLNLKKMAKAIGVKKVTMAEAKIVERSTGYVLGGVSPLGQKKHLKTVLEQSANNYATIYVSAGKRGLEIELPPAQLVAVLNAEISIIVNDE